jgi:hypothetical protein
MQKRFEIKRRLESWEVRHNMQAVRCCKAKREAIRSALTLGWMQRRLGDDSEIVVCDETGAEQVRRMIYA